MKKLSEDQIVKDTTPTIQEIRARVLLMLFRMKGEKTVDTTIVQQYIIYRGLLKAFAFMGFFVIKFVMFLIEIFFKNKKSQLKAEILNGAGDGTRTRNSLLGRQAL